MRTVTITLHDTDNSGSSLQAFALQRFLLDHGVENEIIDYVPSYVKNNGHPLKTFLRKIIFSRDSTQRERKFINFIHRYLKTTKEKYRTYSSLKKTPPPADIYITGSDQLWNSSYSCGRDKAFYLDFAQNGKKLAYAVSLGKEDVPKKEIQWIMENTRNFKWISVRERSSKELLDSQGVLNVDTVCDPVLLLDRAVYESMRTPVIRDKKYILVYLVQENELLDKSLKEIKEKLGCEVVLIGNYRVNCDCDYQIRDVAPEEFLDLIANAEFVISSSFHATVFSTIFQKPFAVILPGQNQARIKQFLEILDLERRIICQPEDISELIQPIDFNAAYEKLSPFLSYSRTRLLQNVLNN